jgi:hypothetical protein
MTVEKKRSDRGGAVSAQSRVCAIAPYESGGGDSFFRFIMYAD